MLLFSARNDLGIHVGSVLKTKDMLLRELNEKKNAFNLKEWERCHVGWRVIDVVTWHVCGWQWITITARKGHGKSFEVFHFNNKEPKSWWKTNERYFWKKCES